MTIADFGVYEAGITAEQRGFHAVCIDTMSDSGVAALRSELDIPVIGPGRASVLTALMFGNCFSILAMWPHWQHLYDKTLSDLGLQRHCVSVRSIEATPDNQALLAGKEDDIFPQLEAEGKKAVEQDGADVILLGSTTMHPAHGYLAERLPVPVINPGPLTYKLTEAALGLGLTHSRKACPASPAPKHDVVHAMVDAAEKSGH